MTTTAQLFDLAVHHHRSGNLRQAEPLYRQVLQTEPAHAPALHLLGLLAHQAGCHEVAIDLIRQAIALDPDDAGWHANLGLVLMNRGRPAEAALCFRQALRINPLDADTHINLGNTLKDQGQLADAEECYRQALRLNPDHAHAHNNLANVFLAQGRLAEAALCLRQVLKLDPANAMAHYNLGNVLKDQGQMTEAALCYRQALFNDPRHADAHNNLGIILGKQGQAAEAVECYRQVLRIKADHADALNNMGIALMEQGQLAEATACFRQALHADPLLADVHMNLGNALKEQGQMPEALECYRQALRVNPKHADAHNNLGIALRDQGQLAEAVECYRQALACNPQHADAHNNLSNVLSRLGHLQEALEHNDQALLINPAHALAHWQRALLRLQQGDLAGGWPDYEYRWVLPKAAIRHLQQPRWDGSPLGGKSILLYPEQGLGDTIHFLRYAPLVKRRGGTVLVECQPALVPLLKGSPGIDQLIAGGSPLPPHDVQAPLLSLPGIFGTTLETIPAAVPYLRTDAGLVEYWWKQLEPLGGFKVGIAWQGNPKHPGDRYRSSALRHFEALAAIEGVRLVSLQKGPGAEQIEERFPVLDLSDRLDRAGAFLDSAAVMMSLDLVVTVDSAIAHLAGALAVPVWVALSVGPDWRWLLERADSPWYPTMRLFRQSRLGDWGEVFERIAMEIRRMQS